VNDDDDGRPMVTFYARRARDLTCRCRFGDEQAAASGRAYYPPQEMIDHDAYRLSGLTVAINGAASLFRLETCWLDQMDW
jgi:hypothetical protein